MILAYPLKATSWAIKKLMTNYDRLDHYVKHFFMSVIVLLLQDLDF